MSESKRIRGKKRKTWFLIFNASDKTRPLYRFLEVQLVSRDFLNLFATRIRLPCCGRNAKPLLIESQLETLAPVIQRRLSSAHNP